MPTLPAFRRVLALAVVSFALLWFNSCETNTGAIEPSRPLVLRVDPARAAQMSKEIREKVPTQIAEGLELTLWAADSLAPDPIALAMDEQGRAYITRTVRQKHSEFDIRGYQHWEIESISLNTVSERRAFLHKTFAPELSEENSWLEDLNGDGLHDWHDLAVEEEQIYVIDDESGDGIADRATLFHEGFRDEVSDIAGGVLPVGKDVYVAMAPDMWKLQDSDGDGRADRRKSISSGYGVHIGFSGHNMSGIIVGPEGKIYWNMGDIGSNIVDQDGKRWEYPNEGIIARCNPDGSDFEVFAGGLRNTHEFVFDDFGNLISVDNDGDHPGEEERLVYVVNGSDSGWRANWQYGKYNDPANNTYKVWMAETLFKPHFEGQAAYITPPVANYHSGPAGMKYNPGTALGEKWRNKFFVAEFTGSPARSRVFAFELEPKGATFAFKGEEVVTSGILATGLDFGPDGALYIADWIDGWGTKDYGRIWKLDAPGAAASVQRQEVKRLLVADFSEEKVPALSALLGHADRRVRGKAQFELASRGKAGARALLDAAQNSKNKLARIHGLWGLWQLSNKSLRQAESLTAFLKDQDAEIRAQAAKIIGDVRYAEAGDALVPLLRDTSARVRFFAAEALGRIGHKPAIQPIVQMLAENNDADVYLRHAGALALARIGEAEPIVALAGHANRGVRIAAVVALRRLRHPGVASFLKDKDEYIVTEAARAINDDLSIEGAVPALANCLRETRFTSEPLLRRAINANLRAGKPENIKTLVDYAARQGAPENLRAEALSALGVWAKPSVLDRVDGRYRGPVTRDAAPARAALEPVLAALLAEPAIPMQIAAADAAGRLKIKSAGQVLNASFKQTKTPEVRAAVLKALAAISDPQLASTLETALKDGSPVVRSAAMAIIPEVDLPKEKTVALFTSVISRGTLQEQQTALASLGKISGDAAAAELQRLLDQLIAGKLNPAIQLELEESIEASGVESLKAKLKTYQASLPSNDPLAPYRAALAGGNVEKGQSIFISHTGAQCIRCHSIYEYGGDVGPNLTSIGSKYSPLQLLQAVITPSATLAPGFGVTTVTLKAGEQVTGVIEADDAARIVLKQGQGQNRTIAKADIAKREDVPSSMPPMGTVLTKRELRDLIAWLSMLKGENI